MKKLLKPITAPLDFLYRLRTTYGFLTMKEARASVKAAETLDTATGRAFVAKMENQFADLQRIRLKPHGKYIEIRLTLDTAALEVAGDDTAVGVVAEITATRVLRVLQDRRREREAKVDLKNKN